MDRSVTQDVDLVRVPAERERLDRSMVNAGIGAS